jgi:predicted  nucleic acid-binding Zn-ribbon protein
VNLPEAVAALGSGLAAFAATWLTLFKPLQKEMEKPANEIALLRQKIEALEKKLEKMEEKAERAEAVLKRTVTDEEFAAYSSSTTEAVNGLTEKVGRVTGALETWQQMRR